ncbi:hypothetical protein IAU60_000930 [Kwoniella sp. DSM 27419]
MSSTPTDQQYAAIGNINFTGGFPNSKDLAPSIVFLICYAALTPLLIWRWARKQDRTKLLIRPSIFQACRIGMLVLRAYMSKNTYGEGLLIAELVLVSIGFLFLIEPTVSCWRLQVESCLPKEDQPAWVRRIALFLKLATLAAIFTAVAGAGLISKALDNPDTLHQVKTLRRVSSVLSLGVVGVLMIAAVLTYFHFSLDTRGTLYILTLGASLTVVALYRIIQTFSTDPSAPVRSQAAFWILQTVFELIAFILLLAISIPTWFPGPDKDLDRARASINSPVQDVELGQKAYPQPSSRVRAV